jgi:hypothetical protein
MITRLEDKELKRQNRRQLLKLAPVAVLGVFAFPKVSDRLVSAGVRFSDWASGGLLRTQHLAQTFSNFGNGGGRRSARPRNDRTADGSAGNS